MWNASVKKSLLAPTGSSTVLNGSGVVQHFHQNSAYCCIAQYCLLSHGQITVVNMPHLIEGEDGKLLLLDQMVAGLKTNSKNI